MTDDMTFKNSSGLEFADISSELWREYLFDNGMTIRIEEPLRLHVSLEGHRLFDSNGISHYVPNRWLHLRWKAKNDHANFVL